MYNIAQRAAKQLARSSSVGRLVTARYMVGVCGCPNRFDPLLLLVLSSGNRSARLRVKSYNAITGKTKKKWMAEPSYCLLGFVQIDDKTLDIAPQEE